MPGFRLSKYAPALRDAQGAFRHETWTSISDVGKKSGGQLLTADEYLRVEAGYIEVAVRFHALVGSPELVVSAVEGSDPSSDMPGEILRESLVNGQLISAAELPVVIRTCLREMAWCKLETLDQSCMIHFGYDYYMYLTGNLSGSDRCVRA